MGLLGNTRDLGHSVGVGGWKLFLASRQCWGSFPAGNIYITEDPAIQRYPLTASGGQNSRSGR